MAESPTFQPITPSLPRARSALENRLPQLTPYLARTSQPTANSFLQYAQLRAQRGQLQQSLPEQIQMLRAAETGQAQTAPAEDKGILHNLNPTNFLGNTVDNLRTLTGAIPRMLIPNRGNPLYEEAVGLTNISENVSNALAEGDNLGEDIAGVLNQPGIRLIPGSYVASNIAAGTPEELLANPLFTALDVLPYGQAAAKGTRVFGAARDAAAIERAAIRATPVDTLLGTKVNPVMAEVRPVRPIRTVLTKTLDETGAVVPNRFGRMTLGVGDAVAETRLGKAGTELGLGRAGRALRRNQAMYRQAQHQVLAVLDADESVLSRLSDQNLANVGRSHRALIDDFPSIFGEKATPTYIDDLQRRFEAGDPKALTPVERQAFDRWQEHQSAQAAYLTQTDPNVVRVGDPTVKLPNGQMKPQTFETKAAQTALDGEVIPTKAYRIVRKAERHVKTAREAWFEQLGHLAEAKSIMFGGDDMPAAFRAAGIDDPIPAVTSTSSLIGSKLDDLTLNPVERDIAARYRTALNRLEAAEAPVDLVRHAHVVRQELRRMMGRKAFAPILDDLTMAMREVKQATHHVSMANRRGPTRAAATRVARAERNLNKAISASIPARFYPRMFDEFDRLVLENTLDLPPAQRAALERQIGERFYGGLDDFGIPKKDIERWRREARDTWIEAKATGQDPAFIPSVSAEQAARLGYSNPSAHLITPSTAKVRTWDVRPTVGGPAVALTHQMKELIEAKVSREIVTSIEQVHGRTEKAWREEALRRGMTDHEATAWIDKHTVPNFETYMKAGKTSNAPGAKQTQIRVPREMADMFAAMNKKNPLEMVFDPVTRVFRAAVLPMSPRWHVYNVLGGAAISVIENPAVMRSWMKAYREMDAGLGRTIADEFRGRTPHRLSKVEAGATPTGAGGSMAMPGEHLLTEPIGSANRTLAVRKFAEGTKLGQLWDQVQAWKESKGIHPLSASHAMNSWFDDFYKTATNIDAYEAAVRKGASTAEAEVAAMEAVRKTFQQWDEMLPMERVIMKSVFPFYGWAKFSLGFVMRYPADHALRTAVMAQFARNELEDQGTGLPDDFRHLFQMSGIDEDGNAKFLRMSGMNPFRDTADWFTLQGMVGNVNPVISATLQAMGVNPMQGTPALYPDLEYDPETGGLRAKTPDFFGALVSSTIPQTRLINNLITDTAEFNELLQHDPQAARNMLYGQMGLPVMVESINIPQEQFRAESNRYKTFVEARREAVRTGNLAALQRYPGTTPISEDDVTGLPEGSTLDAYIAQLQLMNERGLLEEYRGDGSAPSIPSLLGAVGGYERQVELTSS